MDAHTQALTPKAVATLLDLPERQVRKEAEHGILPATVPPRLDFVALVYLRMVTWLGLDVGVETRHRLYAIVVQATQQRPVPESVVWSRALSLELGDVVRDVVARLEAFERWKDGLVTRADILGGEPVFPGSRIAVRHIGGLAEHVDGPSEIRADYPELSDEDIHFAQVYNRAFPKLGRPRPHEAAPR